MAGSIPPLVSSSPPPLCAFDDDEEEEEDEFGMYTAAEDIEYNERISFKETIEEKQGMGKCRGEQDSTSQDSATDSGLCPDSEGVSPTPNSDEERTVKQSDSTVKQSDSNVDEKLYQADASTLNDKVNPEGFNSSSGFSALADIPNVDVIVEDSEDDFGNFENFEHTKSASINPYLPSENEQITELKQTELSDSENENIVSSDFNLDELENDVNKVCDYVNDKSLEFEKPEDISIVNEVCIGLNNQEISDSVLSEVNEIITNDNMHIPGEQQTSVEDCFKSASIPILTTEQSLKTAEFDQQDDEFDDFTDFKADFSSFNVQNFEQSDKVSEHSKPIGEQTHLEESVTLPTSHNDASDDEFSDFTSSDDAFVSAQRSNSVEQFPHIPISDNSEIRTDSEFQDWVSVFPSSSSDSSAHDREEVVILGDNDSVWSRLIPMESSPALSYQWTESQANHQLLTALNIDSRNILAKPWMPRFAANLSCGPLQPVKALEPLQPTPASTVPPIHLSSGPESVPDAHFDWVGSGLTNPLDCPKAVLKQHKTLSAEAEAILSSLPDLSFMRRSYIDFPINKG